MNDLDKEISELKEFISDLKADRAETKAKEAREAFGVRPACWRCLKVGKFESGSAHSKRFAS